MSSASLTCMSRIGRRLSRSSYDGETRSSIQSDVTMRNLGSTDTPNGQPDASHGDSAWVPTFWDRLLWICPIAFVAVAAALLWLFGLTVWTALGVALLLACPVSVALAWLAGRRGDDGLHGDTEAAPEIKQHPWADSALLRDAALDLAVELAELRMRW